MLKKLSILTLIVSLTLVPCMPLPAKAGDKEPVELLVPRAAFAPAAADKGGSLSLIAKKFVSFNPDGLSLVPTNPLVVETLETPVMLSLTIPEDKKRTLFFIATGALHSWQQVSSTAPYRMTGAMRYRLTSSALPAPGEIGFGVGLDGQIDAQPSAVNIFRQRDPTSSFGLDDEVLAWLVKGNFPALTEEQALQTARALIKSEIVMRMTVRVRVRSVSSFDISNAYLQVYGD
ncbi:MAG: hypothetical protein LC800_06165 [Acidobacteria bacterium]|nr:hypothetical protein [Acidobacteriota bacterium]